MSVALLSAKRSKDPSTQVGACIVSPDNRIVSMGYNGFPSMGQVSNDALLPWGKESSCELENKYLYVCHAELNAVLNKNQHDIKGCRIYTTLFPCNECAKLIIQSGITKVIYLSDSKADTAPFRSSRRLLNLAQVTMEKFHCEEGVNKVRIDMKQSDVYVACID